MKKCICFLAILCLFASCKSSYQVFYDIGLSSVESPADAKIQYGESKVVKFMQDDNQMFRYEDKYIVIV